MDVVTHALSGLALGLLSRSAAGGTAGAADEEGARHSAASSRGDIANRAVRITVGLAAVLPDIDIVARIAGPFAYFKYHRGPTHSILGVLVLSALLAVVVARFLPAASKKRLFLWALLGMAVHVGLDLLTSYSTFLLWPFSGRPFFTGILRFSDRTGWYILGGAWALGFLAGRFRRSAMLPAYLGAAALLVYGGYIGARAWVRFDLSAGLADHYAGESAGRIVVTSRLPGIAEWGYVVDGPDTFITGSVTYPGGAVKEFSRLPKDHDERMAGFAMASEIARFVRDFAPLLYISTEKRAEGYVVSLGDLRYGPSPRPRAEILLDGAGAVVGETYLGFGGRYSRRP